MKPKIAIPLGVAGMLAALGTAIANANGIFTGRPYLAYLCWGISLALIMFAILMANVKVSPDPKADTHGSVSPISIHLENIGNSVQQQIKQSQGNRSIIPIASSKPQPNIHFIEATVADIRPGLDLGDFTAAVACFRNERIVGQKIEQPTVRAQIIYKDHHGNEFTDVSNGVWTEDPLISPLFATGERKCLILFLLSNQGRLKKLWKEAYTTSHSWMSGGSSIRIRDEDVKGKIAVVEVRLLNDHTDIGLLDTLFDVEDYQSGELPSFKLHTT
ncbi:MAG: hypothetical protein LAO03_22640 [Acidobacteriia bacterium]|nr:hypothetical protein [Terriglobia bacterium]